MPIKESREFHQAQVAAGTDSRLLVVTWQGPMVTFINPKTRKQLLEFFSDVL
ncbi:MAG: hypothetical protein GY904_00485 [Planctomycetaceae bacterium]|nr:hypothetical protein [Planctomycetaceae bacterium]